MPATPRVGGPIMTAGMITKSSITQRYGGTVTKRVQKAIYKLGQETRDMARAKCPVDTGALKSSIYVSGTGTGSSQSAGYFRAITAASKRRVSLEIDSPFVRDIRTQARTSEYMRDLQEYGLYDNAPFARVTTAGEERFFITVGAAAWYAGFVEYGTTGKRSQPAQPFMGPALRWAENQLLARMRSAINGGV